MPNPVRRTGATMKPKSSARRWLGRGVLIVLGLLLLLGGLVVAMPERINWGTAEPDSKGRLPPDVARAFLDAVKDGRIEEASTYWDAQSLRHIAGSELEGGFGSFEAF